MTTKMQWMCLLVVSQLGLSAANYTFTYEMAAQCKEHICRNGYKYDTFYRVDSESRKLEPGVVFEMHIAVLGASNGHILLSTWREPRIVDPVYEFVIGGGANKFSELRRNKGRNAKMSVQTVGILSPVEYRAFYIKISEDGLVELGKEGEQLPLLSYFDLDPLQINYFSFAAWNGELAKFLYDCPVAGENGTEITSDSQMVEKPMSPSDNLKSMLLSNRSANLAPASIVNVTFGSRITSVNYDAFEAKLDTSISIVMSWNDDKMVWDPTENNFTKSLKFKPGQIWKPVFYIQNSDKISFLDSENPSPIYFQFNGVATYSFHTKVSTLCGDGMSILSNWPRDEYECTLVLAPWALHESISVDYMDPNVQLKFMARVRFIQSEWFLLTIRDEIVENTDLYDLDYKLNDTIVIHLRIGRRPGAYNLVFYTPLFVLITFLLISFWTTPLSMSRVWVYAVMSFIICMGLSYVDFLVPSHTLPTIVVLYTYVLFGALLALLAQVVMINPSIQATFKGVRAQSFITNRFIRCLCCLPPMKTCNIYETVNEGYTAPNDDDSGVGIAPRNNLEEMEVEESSGTGEKEEFAEVVDKFMFALYSFTYAVLLAYHY